MNKYLVEKYNGYYFTIYPYVEIMDNVCGKYDIDHEKYEHILKYVKNGIKYNQKIYQHYDMELTIYKNNKQVHLKKYIEQSINDNIFINIFEYQEKNVNSIPILNKYNYEAEQYIIKYDLDYVNVFLIKEVVKNNNKNKIKYYFYFSFKFNIDYKDKIMKDIFDFINVLE